MKKRRFLSLIVAMVMMMSTCLTAMAATGSFNNLTWDADNIVTNTSKVTISNIPEDVDSNIDFTTYQILKAVYDESTNTISYELMDWVSNAVSEGAILTYTTDAEVRAAILASIEVGTTDTQTDGQSTTEQTEILNALAAYVAANSVTAYTFTSASDDWQYTEVQGNTGYASATLPVGAYLVVPTADNMSFLNTMVSVNAESNGASTNEWKITANGAYLKGTLVSLTKEVKEEDDSSFALFTDAQIGETVTYQLTVTVPTFDKDVAGVVFKVVDVPENVSIKMDTLVVKGLTDGEDWSTGGELVADGGMVSTPDYKADWDVTVSDALTIDFSDYYMNQFCTTSGTYPYKTVMIQYDAVVLSTAASGDIGNTNTATLTYGHSGLTDNNSETKTAKVYTYQVTLNKYESGTATGLAGAQFKIYTLDASGTITDTLTFSGNAGAYSVDDTSTETNITTDSNGDITITGLDSNTTYMIEEVVAPSGYSINSNVLTFVISGASGNVTSVDAHEYTDSSNIGLGTEVTDPTAQSWTKDASSQTVLELTLADTKIDAMPATGSIGIIIFTVLGVCLMIVAVFLMTSSKDSKKKQAQ